MDSLLFGIKKKWIGRDRAHLVPVFRKKSLCNIERKSIEISGSLPFDFVIRHRELFCRKCMQKLERQQVSMHSGQIDQKMQV